MTKIVSCYLLLLLVLIAAVAGCGKEAPPLIRYDGFYGNPQTPSPIHIFFRFYKDGTVTASLPVPANNQFALKLSELDKDSKECTIKGKYVLKGNNVKFKLMDKNGSADFSGEFKPDAVLLSSHSNINGKDSRESYVFTKLK
jgi:hypothetical protein